MNSAPRPVFENDVPLAQGVTPSPPIESSAAKRRLLSVLAVLVAHLALLLLGAIATAIVNRRGNVAILPSEPLLYLIVALLMAHCSLVAVWWARGNWPSHAKTLVAVLCGAGLWTLLLRLLDGARTDPAPAAAWAAGLSTQLVLTAIAASLLEAAANRKRRAAGQRFSILFLLIWTSVVAVLLGAGRRLAEAYGWTGGSAVDWEFARQLQCVSVANALLAASLMASARLLGTWRSRGIACGAIVCVTALVMPLVMFAMFGVPGQPTYVDMLWLWGGEAIFLVAALVSLEIGNGTSAGVGRGVTA